MKTTTWTNVPQCPNKIVDCGFASWSPGEFDCEDSAAVVTDGGDAGHGEALPAVPLHRPGRQHQNPEVLRWLERQDPRQEPASGWVFPASADAEGSGLHRLVWWLWWESAPLLARAHGCLLCPCRTAARQNTFAFSSRLDANRDEM